MFFILVFAIFTIYNRKNGLVYCNYFAGKFLKFNYYFVKVILVMDLTARKNKFIEQFMKIVSVEKLERFEEFLRVETNDNKKNVAHTIIRKTSYTRPVY